MNTAQVIEFPTSQRPYTAPTRVAAQREHVNELGREAWVVRCPQCHTRVVWENRNQSIAGVFQCWKTQCKKRFEV